MPPHIVPRLRTALLVLAAAGAPLLAQQPRALTADDYARAERFLAPSTVPLVFRASVRPAWLPNDRFWYRTTTPAGAEFILVDPSRGTRRRAFDQARLAAGLGAAAGATYDSLQLPFTQFEYAPDGAVRVRVAGRRYDCNAETGRCGAAVDEREAANMAPPAEARRGPPVVRAPDGRRAAFIRD
jgi:hypothetical protein